MDSGAEGCFSFREGAHSPGISEEEGWDQQHCLAAHVPCHQGPHGTLTLNTSLSPFQVIKAGILAGTLSVEKRSSLRKSRPLWDVRWQLCLGQWPIREKRFWSHYGLRVTSAHSLKNCSFFKMQAKLPVMWSNTFQETSKERADTTELDYLETGIKGGITIENGAVRRKYFKNIFKFLFNNILQIFTNRISLKPARLCEFSFTKCLQGIFDWR